MLLVYLDCTLKIFGRGPLTLHVRLDHSNGRHGEYCHIRQLFEHGVGELVSSYRPAFSFEGILRLSRSAHSITSVVLKVTTQRAELLEEVAINEEKMPNLLELE